MFVYVSLSVNEWDLLVSMGVNVCVCVCVCECQFVYECEWE